MVGLVGVEARVQVRARAGRERVKSEEAPEKLRALFKRCSRERDLRLARCFQQSNLALPTGGLSNPIVRMGRSPAHVQAFWG